MICPNCKKENEDDAIFCVSCGEKISDGSKICPNCGDSSDADSLFCINCGHKFNNASQNNYSNADRTLELILGILGAVFGFIGATVAFFFSAFSSDLMVLGFSAFFASIIGLVGSIYIRYNAKYGGIIVIISAVWLLISISYAGAIGFILLLIAGILALVRK